MKEDLKILTKAWRVVDTAKLHQKETVLAYLRLGSRRLTSGARPWWKPTSLAKKMELVVRSRLVEDLFFDKFGEVATGAPSENNQNQKQK